MPYPALGYAELELLNITDRKWLVECFGEPESHQGAQDFHAEIWQAALADYRSRKEAHEAEFEQHIGEVSEELSEDLRQLEQMAREEVDRAREGPESNPRAALFVVAVLGILLLVALCAGG